MKSLVLLMVGGLFFPMAVAAQQPAKSPSGPVAKLKTKEDSLQYALGSYMGNYLLQGGFSTLNVDLFLTGLNDVYKRNPRALGDSTVYALLSKFQEETARARSKFLEQQLFEVLKDNPEVKKLASGVQYLIIKPADGPKPQATDSVLIHFKGTLPTGVVFENTFVNNTPVLTTPAMLIPGLREILQLMSAGATYEAFIPSALAYGETRNNRIPPNSALMITVELLQIRR